MDLLKLTPKTHVVISGGAGFIGSHLSARLLSTGVKVTILTRHVDAPRARPLAAAGTKVVRWDASASTCEAGLEGLPKADLFFHLAADVSVAGPALRATNVEGTARALTLADRLAARYVIFASSIEAQGPGSESEIPLAEGSPCRPVSEYGASKAEAEQVVTQWATSDRQALILRIGNIYGPGSPWLLQPSLLALIGAAPLRHAWSTLAHRQFQPLYLADLIEGILRAVGGRLTGLYNITGRETISLAHYLRMVAELAGLSEQFERLAGSGALGDSRDPRLPPDFAYFLMSAPDRCHRVYDNTKLVREIGDYGRWPFLRGLAATLQWYHTSGGLPAMLKAVRRRQGAPVCT